jgi:hypothetical protein
MAQGALMHLVQRGVDLNLHEVCSRHSIFYIFFRYHKGMDHFVLASS